MKKSWSTRSHFTHARSCCARSIEFTRVRNDRPSIRTYSSWKGDTFPFVRFTGYKESNQNQFGRVLRFAFALTYYKTYLFFSSFSNFDSCSWREHLSYGVCRLRARVLLKTLSSLLNKDSARGCRALTWYQVRNILARLCFAPDDSQPLGALVPMHPSLLCPAGWFPILSTY